MATLLDDSPDLSMRIIETTLFTRQIEKLVGDDDKQNLLDELILFPGAGDLIKGSAGLRKLRWCVPGKGKRGGIRVIYYWHRGQVMYLLLAYRKNRKDDLSAEELKILKALVQQEKQAWKGSSSEN